MGVANKYTIFGSVWDTTLLGGMTHQDVAMNTVLRGEASSGEIWPRMLCKVDEKPQFNFATRNIAAALNLCGLTGTDISGLGAGLNLYGQKYVQASIPATGAVHRRFKIVQGLVVPRTISIDHQGDAVLTLEAFATYDGSNDPVQISDTSISLPAGLTDAERFTLGKFTVESELLGDLKNLTIDFGIEVGNEGGDSDVWPTFSWIQAVNPVISFTSGNTQLVKSDAIPIGGFDISHANTLFYLRKRTSDEASFVVDGTAEHISFTAAGYCRVESAFDGDADNQGAQFSGVVQAKYDGSNNPLVIDTTAAIV